MAHTRLNNDSQTWLYKEEKHYQNFQVGLGNWDKSLSFPLVSHFMECWQFDVIVKKWFNVYNTVFGEMAQTKLNKDSQTKPSP